MFHSSAMLKCLEDRDVAAVRKLWAHIAPNLPQPSSDNEALATIHYARTQCRLLTLRQRAYSHQWLLDNALPSGLPDELRPKAERMYPPKVGVVGISVNSKYPVVRNAIQGAMENAVRETYADGHRDQPEVVKKRMMEARDREKKALGLGGATL